MLKTTDEKGNIIYHFKPLNEIFKEASVKFDGHNNILFLANEALLYKSNLHFRSDEALIFIANSSVTAEIALDYKCSCYIGNAIFFNYWLMSRYIQISEKSNFVMGDNSLLSGSIVFESFDWHLVYDSKDNKRINKSKSIFMGDHCWLGRGLSVLKGASIFSGAIIGADSVVTAKPFFSNSINAGNPCKERKKEIFWSGECLLTHDDDGLQKYDIMQKDDFKFSFEKDKFLNPTLLDERLNALDTAAEKLEFVYDYIYNNTYKNRFALFENSDTSTCTLYKDKSKASFKSLEFKNVSSKTLSALNLPVGAVEKIKNQLSYKLGQAMILNSKSLAQILQMPFILYKIYKEHCFEEKIKQINIKQNLIPKPLKLEDYADFNEALKIKNHLSYKLGQSFIKSLNNKYLFFFGGGVLKFIFYDLSKLLREFKKKRGLK